MKCNDKVEAILEIASFTLCEPYQIEFVEKADEFVASALINAKNAIRMRMLLDKSQEQAEIMQAQEEEMSRNEKGLEKAY